MHVCFILCFIVGPTKLMATKFPASAVKEGTTVTLNCSSDEGNPPPLIHWNTGSGNAKVKLGKFNASTVESTLSIVVDRSLNQETISCFIRANKTKHQQLLNKSFTLSVQCEPFYYLT